MSGNYLKIQPYLLEIIGPAEQRQGNYGPQHNWPVRSDGIDYILSQSVGSGLDTALSSGTVGSQFNVIKQPNPEHQGSFRFVVTPGGTGQPQFQQPAQQPAAQPVQQAVVQPEKTGVNWALKDAKQEHSIAKAVCLKLAVHSFKGDEYDEALIIDRYQSLMRILNDDLDTVMCRLQSAKNVFHLDAISKKYGELWRAILTPGELKIAVDEHMRLKTQFTKPADQPPIDPFDAGEDVGDSPLPF